MKETELLLEYTGDGEEDVARHHNNRNLQCREYVHTGNATSVSLITQ